MKRLAIMAVAAMTALAPIAATSASADPYGRGGYDRDYRHDRGDYRDGYRDGRRHDSRRDYRDERRAYRDGYRDARRAHWRRGDRVPAYYHQRWERVNYRYHRDRGLYAPPRGYHWVRDDRSGEYLLVGIATGVILGAILSQ